MASILGLVEGKALEVVKLATVALAELEEITDKLEDGKESLEASMKLYEYGLSLKEFCEQKLKEAEGKWLMLKKQKDGSVVAEELPNDKIPEPNQLQGQMF